MSAEPAVIVRQYVQSKSSCPTLFLNKTGKDIKDLKNEGNEFSLMETESYATSSGSFVGVESAGAGDRTRVSFSSPGVSSGSHPSHVLQLHTPVCGLCFRFLQLARDGVCSALWPAWARPSGPLGLPPVTAGSPCGQMPHPTRSAVGRALSPTGIHCFTTRSGEPDVGNSSPSPAEPTVPGTAWRGQSQTDMRTLRCRHGYSSPGAGHRHWPPSRGPLPAMGFTCTK